jgi:DNA-binding GntR family transcriptional regulator
VRLLNDVLTTDVLQAHRDMLKAIAEGDPERADAAGRCDARVLIDEFRESLADLPTSQLLLKT